MCLYVLKYVNRLDKIADRKEVCLRINIRKKFALTTYITKSLLYIDSFRKSIGIWMGI